MPGTHILRVFSARFVRTETVANLAQKSTRIRLRERAGLGAMNGTGRLGRDGRRQEALAGVGNVKALRRVLARASLVAAIVLCLSRIAVASNLCPPPDPLPPEADDMRMKEIEFNAKVVADGLRYLEDDAPQILINKGRTGDQNTESLLGYDNYLKKIRGYVLRQEALLRLAERDLLIERNRRGRASKADVAAAKIAFEQAKGQFCEFVKNAYYSD